MVVKITEYSDYVRAGEVHIWTRTENGYWIYSNTKGETGEGATRDVAKMVLLTAIAEHDVDIEYKSCVSKTEWEDVPRDDLIEFIDYLSE